MTEGQKWCNVKCLWIDWPVRMEERFFHQPVFCLAGRHSLPSLLCWLSYMADSTYAAPSRQRRLSAIGYGPCSLVLPGSAPCSGALILSRPPIPYFCLVSCWFHVPIPGWTTPGKVFQSGLRIIPFELANDAQNLLCDIVQFSGLEKHLLKTTPCCCLGSLLPNLHSPPPDSESKILQKWSCGSWKFSLHWLGNECLFSGLHQAFGGLATAALPLCCTFVLFL